MTTFADLNSRIRRILGDVDGSGYTDELIIDAISAALDAILPWTPKTLVSTITGDGAATTFTLPADVYEIEAIVDEENEVLPRAFLSPHQFIGEDSPNYNDWIEYPSGSVRFAKVIDLDDTYTVFYLAHWTKPTTAIDFTNVLEAPAQSEMGICLYAAAYALLPAAVSASEIRQFGTKVDSGTPEQNPMQKTAMFLLEFFQKEMNRHPKHQKAMK
jgi:hypothetical protein